MSEQKGLSCSRCVIKLALLISIWKYKSLGPTRQLAIYSWHSGLALIAQTVIQNTAELLTYGNKQGKSGVRENQIKVTKLEEISCLMLDEYLGTNWFHKL